MSLRERIAALRRDIRGREHRTDPESKRLTRYWRHELAAALKDASHVNHAVPVVRDGFDCLGELPGSAARVAGATFVLRYLGEFTRAEAVDYSSHGIDCGAIYETTATRALEGGPAGRQDGEHARRLMTQLGMPNGRPAYFTCDTESAGHVQAVRAYVRGAVSVLGWQRVGMYGDYGLIEALHATFACRFLWQTLAWSGGKWSPHANLRQLAIERHVGPYSVDVDRAYTADFGQWRI